MTRLAQTASRQRPATSLARLAALDLAQDDIVRPELRDDAILADRTQRALCHRPGQLDSGRQGWRTDNNTISTSPDDWA